MSVDNSSNNTIVNYDSISSKVMFHLIDNSNGHVNANAIEYNREAKRFLHIRALNIRSTLNNKGKSSSETTVHPVVECRKENLNMG